MACPFFMPTRRSEDGGWLHPSRLPMGGGWQGHCTAPGQEGVLPTSDQLREFCNLGYAASCPRFPRERAWDAVRFSVARDHRHRVMLWYVCEADYRPAEHGTLEYDNALACWITGHRDARIQKMAECYLESYFQKTRQAAAACASSE